MEATNFASSSSGSPLLEELTARGWHFRDMERIRNVISSQSSIPGSICTAESIESELLNMDLRSIGGKCLPDSSVLRKTSHLQCPIVLQVSSSRDISRSLIVNASENSSSKRVLRLRLTDGHSEITAVEYSRVSSISEDIAPGTKVRLQNRADICSGILCLKENVITILGGAVESILEEWKLKRKYLNFPRHTLKLSKEDASSGPPPFEKLQVGVPKLRVVPSEFASTSKGAQGSSNAPGFSGSSANDFRQSFDKGKSKYSNEIVQIQKNNANMGSVTDDLKLHVVDEHKEKPISSSARVKAVAVTAHVPVQNQSAAQKLLQRTSQPNFGNHNPRSHRHGGKFKDEDASFITLDEWEQMKAGTHVALTHDHSNTCQDEDLARQLQKQFDLEDIQGSKSTSGTDAESIKNSMFNFERDGGASGTEFRGRGRGRGKGRGRGGRRGGRH